MTDRIVIHRRKRFDVTVPATGKTYTFNSRWFEYDGRVFLIGGGVVGNRGYGYTVDDLETGETVSDGYDDIRHIRLRFYEDYRSWTPPSEREGY